MSPDPTKTDKGQQPPGRLLIVSNRLPISIVRKKNELRFQPSMGGLATGLAAFYKSYESLWIGWPGIGLEKLHKAEKRKMIDSLASERCYPVFLTQYDIENYYLGFCNKTIWPLFHYFTQFAVYGRSMWRAYKRVNEVFCDAIVDVVRPGDTIWVQDYQLLLLPGLLRERLHDVPIGFFLHIPFPAFEIFRMLPWRREILEGLLGADLIGFHTYDYVQNFLSSVRRILGREPHLGQLSTTSGMTKVDAFPLGIDYKRFSTIAQSPETEKAAARIRRKTGDRKIILSIDRLDYTKGIVERLESFRVFLDRYPEYRNKVIFILVAVPSRTRVEHYMMLKKHLDELVGNINGEYGTIGWVPVWYLYRFLPFNELIAMYSVADVCLVTPFIDGMNLIAKEFMATKSDGKGALILSEMAGAAHELGEALIVNPNNKEEVASAINEALSEPEKLVSRNLSMQRRLQRYDVTRWAADFVDALSATRKLTEELAAHKLTAQGKDDLMRDYRASSRRLLLLDYDGTLISFTDAPEKAKPDENVLELLAALARDPKNEVVIISGRKQETLEEWFGGLDIAMVAEHGAWIRERGGRWHPMDRSGTAWMEEIRPVLERYVDRTPGSFLEEKQLSLVWHYRRTEPEMGMVRAQELREELLRVTAGMDIGVLEGSKVIEVKNTGTDKGKAASFLAGKEEYGFILAVGDDWTDEMIFNELPDSAYSIKVGLHPTGARFCLDSVEEVRALIKELGGTLHG